MRQPWVSRLVAARIQGMRRTASTGSWVCPGLKAKSRVWGPTRETQMVVVEIQVAVLTLTTCGCAKAAAGGRRSWCGGEKRGGDGR